MHNPYKPRNSSVAMFASVAVLALATLISLHSAALAATRQVSGVVTDKRENTLPNAVVQLKNMSTLDIRSQITHVDGRYYFDGLDPDIEYQVRVRYRTYWTPPKTVSKFDSKLSVELNFEIPTE